MSIFDMLFGKKTLPDGLKPLDYDYYASLKANNETAKNMLSAVNKSGDMPPLFSSDTVSSKPAVQSQNSPTEISREPIIDSETAAYSSWAEANGKDLPKPTVIPVQPNLPPRPNVTPIQPVKENVQKTGYHYDSDFGYIGAHARNKFGTKPHTWEPIAPKIPEKDVFAFIVENSKDTFNQKQRIIDIVSQIVESKKDAIFLFVKVGTDQTPFSPMDYNSVKEKNIVSSLISESQENTLPNLASALFYLVNNLNVFSSDTFTFSKKKYKLGNCSIVCIGTGSCIQNEDSLRIVSSCISKLQKISKLKTFKYFCIADSDAINVSALGFPVIGHIISDFYE